MSPFVFLPAVAAIENVVAVATDGGAGCTRHGPYCPCLPNHWQGDL